MQVQDTTILSIFAGSGIDRVPEEATFGLHFVERMQIYQPTWYFIYLFILLGLFAWIRIYYGQILKQTVQAAANYQATSKMFKSNSLLQNQLDGLLYLFYFLSMAFLLYYLELKIGLNPYGLQGALLYLLNVALLAGLFFGRVLIYTISGILFNQVRAVREYLYNMFIYNKLLGLAALPLVFLLIYTRGTLQEALFWLTLFILSGVLLMRLIRTLVFSYRKDVLIIYMFLYLCALEIAPLILLYRWLEGIL